MKLTFYIFVILFINPSFSSELLANNNKELLIVWLDMDQAKQSRQSIMRYEQTLNSIFEQPLAFVQTPTQNVDIRITNRYQGAHFEPWLKARFPIDVIPAFNLTTRQQGNKADPPLIGVIRRPYAHTIEDDSYLIDDMAVALELLENKRIDGILDYANEAGYYMFNAADLKQSTLSVEQNVDVFFRDAEMLKRFDDAMHSTWAISQNTETVIEKPNEIEKTISAMTKNIQLVLLAKEFDAKNNKLRVSQTDLNMGEWLINEVEQFSIDITTQGNTVKKAYEKLIASNNTCILNTTKTNNRKQYTVYSSVSYVYLDYQLYVKTGSEAESLIKQWLANPINKGKLNLKSYFNTNQRGLVGYYEYIERTPKFEAAIDSFIQTKPSRFLKLSAKEEPRSVQLLNKARIDYLITYPFVIEKEIVKNTFVKGFSSFSFEHYDKPFPVYTGCSKSDTGELFIAEVNTLLEDPEKNTQLLEIIFGRALASDQKVLKKAFWDFSQKQ